jgi:hypothetical protein
MTSELQKLKGKTLKGVTVSKWDENKPFPKGSNAYGGVHGQNRDTITFHCDNGDYVYVADGDCCSTTYIDTVEGPKAGRVLEVQEPEWNDPVRSSQTEDGETKFYKTTLVLEGQGHLDVEYRNESNGYYGGSLELLSAPSEGNEP